MEPATFVYMSAIGNEGVIYVEWIGNEGVSPPLCKTDLGCSRRLGAVHGPGATNHRGSYARLTAAVFAVVFDWTSLDEPNLLWDSGAIAHDSAGLVPQSFDRF